MLQPIRVFAVFKLTLKYSFITCTIFCNSDCMMIRLKRLLVEYENMELCLYMLPLSLLKILCLKLVQSKRLWKRKHGEWKISRKLIYPFWLRISLKGLFRETWTVVTSRKNFHFPMLTAQSNSDLNFM